MGLSVTEPINYHANMAVDRVNRKPYQLVRQSIQIVPFAVIVWSKAVILGRQPVYTVPAPSTAQIGVLVLPP